MIRYKTTVAQLELVQATVVNSREALLELNKDDQVQFMLFWLLIKIPYDKVLYKINKLISTRSVKPERKLNLSNTEAALLVLFLSRVAQNGSIESTICMTLQRELLELITKEV